MISYVNLKPVMNSSSMVNPYKSSVCRILNVFMQFYLFTLGFLANLLDDLRSLLCPEYVGHILN